MEKKRQVYLDNSATTKPYKEVIKIMMETMESHFANASSAHALGFQSEKKINESRALIANTIHATKEEIIFTSGGSESNNFLIRGFVKPGGHVITTATEHPSVRNTMKQLENAGVEVTYLPVDCAGRISIENLLKHIHKHTQLVSIMHVNNEIGTIQDIETIGKKIKEVSTRVKFHVDGVQSYGKLPIDVEKQHIDLFSASGHKIHGPKGIGFCYIKKTLIPEPLIYGGGQERGFRSGTENLPAAVAMAYAATEMHKDMEQNREQVKKVKNYFMERVKELKGVKINSEGERFTPYILSLSFIGVKGEVLLHALEEHGIYVSTGSACSARKETESYVLEAMGLKKEEIRGTLRFSFDETITIEDIDYTMEALKKSLLFLRRLKK